MNILILSQFYSTTKGGGEYVFKTIANILAKNGHKVWIITNNVKDEKYEEADNIKIITVSPTLEYKGGLPPTFPDNIRYVINAFWRGKSVVKEQKIDIIHSNNFSPALAGSLLSYFTKISHITTIHDVFSVYDKDFWKKWSSQSDISYTNARLVPFFEKIMMKLRSDALHTVSEATKKDIQRIGTKKPIHVIPNCIQDKNPITAKVNPKQFACIGRLVFYKNIEVVLKAFTIVKRQFPDANLVIAGDGPHKQSLQALTRKLEIQDIVSFVGYVTPEKKEKILAESNALLFPSMMEGFGLVILESFQQNRPVLVSDIPPMSDIVQNEETGLVIDPNDEDKWAQKIIHLIKNPDSSDNMGKNGFGLLKTKYSQDTFYQNLMNMYESVLNNKTENR